MGQRWQVTAHDTLPAFNSTVGGQWRQAAVWGTWPGGPFSASGQVGLGTQPTPLSAPRYLSVQHAHFATHTLHWYTCSRRRVSFHPCSCFPAELYPHYRLMIPRKDKQQQYDKVKLGKTFRMQFSPFLAYFLGWVKLKIHVPNNETTKTAPTDENPTFWIHQHEMTQARPNTWFLCIV